MKSVEACIARAEQVWERCGNKECEPIFVSHISSNSSRSYQYPTHQVVTRALGMLRISECRLSTESEPSRHLAPPPDSTSCIAKHATMSKSTLLVSEDLDDLGLPESRDEDKYGDEDTTACRYIFLSPVTGEQHASDTALLVDIAVVDCDPSTTENLTSEVATPRACIL